MKGGLSKEVVSDEEEINMGYIHICDQQSRSYKRGGLSLRVLSQKGYYRIYSTYTHVHISRVLFWC